MSIQEKHFVTFYSPGTFFAEHSTKPIEAWDCRVAVEMAENIVERYGAVPYAFEFTTELVSDAIDDGRGGSLKVEPKTIDRSPRYFLGGVVKSYDEILAEKQEKDEILLWNMKANGWSFVVEVTRRHTTMQPFVGEVAIVDAVGKVIRTPQDPDLLKRRLEIEKRWAADASLE